MSVFSLTARLLNALVICLLASTLPLIAQDARQNLSAVTRSRIAGQRLRPQVIVSGLVERTAAPVRKPSSANIEPIIIYYPGQRPQPMKEKSSPPVEGIAKENPPVVEKPVQKKAAPATKVEMLSLQPVTIYYRVPTPRIASALPIAQEKPQKNFTNSSGQALPAAAALQSQAAPTAIETTSTATASAVVSETSPPIESPVVGEPSIPTAPPVSSDTSSPAKSPVVSEPSIPTAPPVISDTSSPAESPVVGKTSVPTTSPVVSERSVPVGSPVVSETSVPAASPANETPSRVESAPVIEKAVTPTGDKLAIQPAPVLVNSSTVATAPLPATNDTTAVVETPATEPTNSPEEKKIAAKSAAPVSNPAIGVEALISSDVVALNNTAVALVRASRYEEALEQLQKALVAAPNSFGLHRNLSIVYEKLNRIDEAVAEADLAVKFGPSEPSALSRLCALKLTSGKDADSLSCYKTLLGLGPLDGPSQIYYGVALFRTGKLDAAVEVLEKVNAELPPTSGGLNAVGVAYFKKKRYTDAASSFKRAVEIDPERGELRFNLALSQLALRNREGALSQYRVLKVDNPKLAEDLYRVLYQDMVVSVDQLVKR